MEIVASCKSIESKLSKCVDYILEGEWSEAKQEVAVAFEEAIVNVCSYAYEKKERGEVRVRIAKDSERIVIDIWDFGRKYDPSTAPLKEIEEGQIGGHGIRLMRAYCDLSYKREGNLNHLTMVKLIG